MAIPMAMARIGRVAASIRTNSSIEVRRATPDDAGEFATIEAHVGIGCSAKHVYESRPKREMDELE